jgi:NADH-quinone oxidoreductase subunit F
VLDETTCAVAAAMKIDEFFKHESCGKCTPCREGTHFLTKVWERIEHGHGRPGDILLLDEVGKQIGFGPGHNCFCLLGPSSVSAVNSAIKYFSDEIQAHIDLGHCPLGYTHAPPSVSAAEGATRTGDARALVH